MADNHVFIKIWEVKFGVSKNGYIHKKKNMVICCVIQTLVISLSGKTDAATSNKTFKIPLFLERLCRGVTEMAGIFFTPMEIWKDIKGYEGYYQASSLGRVRSLERGVDVDGLLKGRILRQFKHSSGGLRVTLSKDYCAAQYFVHQLVAAAFFDEYFLGIGMQVRHKNELSDNTPENLKIYTDTGIITYGGKVVKRYKGVRYDKKTGKYFASISVEGKEVYLGMFKFDSDASIAYLDAAEKYKDRNEKHKKLIAKMRSDKIRNRINRKKKTWECKAMLEGVKEMKERWAKRVEDAKNK